MKHVFNTVVFNDIFDSGLYTTHPFLDSNCIDLNLGHSLSRCGVLTPPILLEQQKDNYDIICGRRRLRYLEEQLQQESCCCRIFSSSTPFDHILAVLVEDQHAAAPLSIMEQACFVELCHRLLDDNKAVESYLKTLPNGRITKGTSFLRPLLQLEENAQKMLHEGVIAEKIITPLLQLNDDDRLVFQEIVTTVQPGGNNQKKLIVALNDIVKREKITLAAFCNEPDVKAALNDEGLTTQQKCATLVEIVTRRRQPQLSAAQHLFSERVKALHLPKNCELSHSPSFERDEVTLSLRFSGFDDLEKHWPEIRTKVEKWLSR
jgi:ParB-like chromosome segregation protein Spo0J